ncbi:hypothetical protein [Ferruginibacter sp.]
MRRWLKTRRPRRLKRMTYSGGGDFFLRGNMLCGVFCSIVPHKALVKKPGDGEDCSELYTAAKDLKLRRGGINIERLSKDKFAKPRRGDIRL